MALRNVLLLSLSLSALGLAAEKPQPPPSREWAVAKVTLTSGSLLVVNYRLAAPPKVNRAGFSWRTSLRCPYEDRGDGSGMPSVEALRSLQQLEAKLEGPTVFRMMSKTGERARETVFQVKDHLAFEAALPALNKALGLECTTSTEQDLKWSQWESAAKQLASAPAKP